MLMVYLAETLEQKTCQKLIPKSPNLKVQIQITFFIWPILEEVSGSNLIHFQFYKRVNILGAKAANKAGMNVIIIQRPEDVIREYYTIKYPTIQSIEDIQFVQKLEKKVNGNETQSWKSKKIKID